MSPQRPMLVFDREGVRAVDRAAIDEYGIPGVVLMENAARTLADEAMAMLPPQRQPPPSVLIVCGAGNNGGDGYAAARHLHNRGIGVTLVTVGESAAGSDASINRDICRRMRLCEAALRDIDAGGIDLIVDAILGTGLDRPVKGAAAQAIDWVNAAKRPVLAADVPSGLDCNTGQVLGACVRADCTVTFVGWKAGFLTPEAQKVLGEIVVGDIGAPIELLRRIGKPMEFPARGKPRR